METESTNKNIMFAACCQSHVQQNRDGGGGGGADGAPHRCGIGASMSPDVGTKIRQ